VVGAASGVDDNTAGSTRRLNRNPAMSGRQPALCGDREPGQSSPSDGRASLPFADLCGALASKESESSKTKTEECDGAGFRGYYRKAKRVT